MVLLTGGHDGSVIEVGPVVEAQVTEASCGNGRRILGEGLTPMGLVPGTPRVGIARGQGLLETFPGPEGVLEVEGVQLLVDDGEVGQHKGMAGEGEILSAVLEQGSEGIKHGIRGGLLLAGRPCFRHVQQALQCQTLSGVVAIERVAVMLKQEREIFARVVVVHLDRGAEVTEERRDRAFRHAREDEGLAGFADHQRAPTCRWLVFFSGQLKREILAIGPHQSECHGEVEGFLGTSIRGRPTALFQCQGEGLCLGVMGAFQSTQRRPRLVIPAAELCEIHTVGRLHGVKEVFRRDGLPIVEFHVAVHALTEAIPADEHGDHANDLGALVVNGACVEVVDLLVGLGLDGVGIGPGILGELAGPEAAGIFDSLDGSGVGVGGIFSVTVDREAFLECDLEPVAQGDAVPRPVMKILVRHNGLDTFVVAVGGRIRVSQRAHRVKDVEALVFHGAIVEGIYGHDHEEIEVILEAERFLVPLHGSFQRCERVRDAVLVAMIHVDLQGHLATGCRCERVFHAGQVSRHQREEVAGLQVRVTPFHTAPAILK